VSDIATATLRAAAESEAAALPPLLLRAEHLASTVLLGTHGRRRAGLGDEFWQYRPYQQGDSRRMIDWRRSARGDQQFVRQREWQIAQTATLWVDVAASMRFSSQGALPQKGDRAQLLALALAALLLRGGEPVGLAGVHLPPRRGRAQLLRLAQHFAGGSAVPATADAGLTDYGLPEARAMLPRANAVFVSDFLGDTAPLEAALAKAAERGVRGVLFQVLDPAEEAFPYQGRVTFESVAGALRHETRQAGGLRDRYLQRLAERKDHLSHLACAAGWQYHCHHTDQPAQAALIWIWQALGADQGRG
jgi:uncharacterized protein (DUF58 family)